VIEIKFQRLAENAKIPVCSSAGAAAFDLFAIEDKMIGPGETVLCKLGLRSKFPAGYYIQIVPRSGLALKSNLTVQNSPGIIDSDYRGEWGVILHNSNQIGPDLVEAIGLAYTSGDGDEVETALSALSNNYHLFEICIGAGERIAQAILVKIPDYQISEVDSINVNETARGSGGFGSTGS
jgi:dUTP pyrophosphatase